MLSENNLTYYESGAKTDAPSGTLPLADIKVVQFAEDTLQDHVFEVVLGIEGREPYRLSAPSHVLRHDWVAALKAATEKQHGARATRATHNPLAAAACAVRRAFLPWSRSMLTEIYLCHTCSCQEILRMETPAQARQSHAKASASTAAARPAVAPPRRDAQESRAQPSPLEPEPEPALGPSPPHAEATRMSDARQG
eukprot:COSAG01_NODE_6991_length_3401_cov_3.070000_4_plen_196_part_00